MEDNMEFTPKTAKLYIEEYNKAVTEKKDSFYFDGRMMAMKYAFYVIQFMEQTELIAGEYLDDGTFKLKEDADTDK